MSSSITLTATDNAPAGTCPTAEWCTSHRELPDCPGIFLHVSDLDVTPSGTVSGLKTYSWATGEPMADRAWIVLFEPLAGTPTMPEPWRMEWLREIVAA